jgi:hypothetical protein
MFKFTIAMVWNNSTALSAFITFTATSTIDFGVLVCVVGSLGPSTNEPSSYTIFLSSLNSNGNPFIDSGLLGSTYIFASLDSSKVSCVSTLSIFSLLACRPSCVYYCCCCYKCCCKCCKCFGLVVVSIQSSHTSPSKCKWSSPSGNFMPC